jgi:DNA polymerase III delta subunit
MLYFFYGQDSYLIKQAYTSLFLKLALQNSKIEDYIIDGKGLSAGDDLLESLSTTSLFSENSLVIFKDFLAEYNKWGKTEQKKFKERLESYGLAESKTKHLLWVEGNLKAKELDNPVGNWLKKTAAIKLSERLKGSSFKKWLINRALEKKVVLDNEATNELLNIFDGETGLIDQYLSKLALLDKKITLSQLEKTVYLPANQNIFALIGAAVAGDKNRAQYLLQKEINSGSHPLYILKMFVYGFRNILIIQSILKDKKDPYKLSGLSPYAVRPNLEIAKKINPERLKNVYNRLAKIDGILKRGQIDPSLALVMFIQSL